MADNEEPLDREEKIDLWVSKEKLRRKKLRERRAKIIPSSTDSIKHIPAGAPLDAMANIARWFGDHPELPTVDVALIRTEDINLTFQKPQDLGYPFQFQSNEGGNQWRITHEDALGLETGDSYGWQTAALTSIGNAASGDKLLLNINRCHLMGLAGLDQFISGVMVGQVMEQATEPWTAEHHIWLVGYRELGPKLVNFLREYHDEFYFHLVETVEQITADDIKDTTATLYVKNSNAASLEAYKRIREENPDRIGMFSDSVLTVQAMFISETDEETAVICNADENEILVIANIIGENDDLYQVMDIYWEKHLENAEQARQAVESLTIEDFLPTEPEETPAETERTGSTSISAEDLEAMFHAGTAERDTPAQVEIEPKPAATETETEQIQPVQIPATPAPGIAPATAPAETVAAEPAPTYASLSLLGEPALHGLESPAKAWTKPAEAVAYLYFNGLTREGVDVARALSPGDEHEGHNARMRRSRITKAIREALPETFRVEGNQWKIDPLTTDLDQITAALAGRGTVEDTVRACEAIQTPLQGCAAWADKPREQIVAQLREILEQAMDRAIDNDQFEIVKAARQATKKL